MAAAMNTEQKIKLAAGGVFAAAVIGGGALLMNPNTEVPPSPPPTPATPTAVATATPIPASSTSVPPASPVSTPDAVPPPTSPPSVRSTSTPSFVVEATSAPTPSLAATPEPLRTDGSPPAFPIEAVLADFTYSCTGENDLVITTGAQWRSYGAFAPDIWMVGQWGTTQRAGEPQTLVLWTGEDQPAANEYTVYNYISGNPPFYYDLTLEAYAQQVEGEPVILDEGTPLEREASRGELFYPGEHGIEPVAIETVHVLCDDGLQWVKHDGR